MGEDVETSGDDLETSRERYEQLLVREILHRVNSEFASAVSLISRTTSRAVSVEAKVALGVVADCIHAQARLNRALQMRDSGLVIDATEYFRELCEALVDARLASTQVNLTLSAGPVLLVSDVCWKVGMIVAELVTNASRHAFGASGGNILVELTISGGTVECRVSDDGSPHKPLRSGQGLKLIEGLTDSLKGSFVQRFEPCGSTSVLFVGANAEARTATC
ncbi:sensor histidine kinase [Tardiphaga sp. P9-11]|uniref:sensor histidine kinase n=1 Tax=Tardiphaga sp. P9-11 TaxID=2024614 RepID=UPI0015620F7E|nr:sensor histidine kinase [Tardiphaga sp. P9-11]